MKRFILFLLLSVLATASGHAQMASSSSLRNAAKTASSGGRKFHKIHEQSRRASEAAKAAAAAAAAAKFNRIQTPSVSGDHIFFTDDKKRKIRDKSDRENPLTSHHTLVRPIPKVKSYMEMEDDRITAKYDSLKSIVTSGVELRWPYNLFRLADYAMRHDDEPFAITCLEHVKIDSLSPEYLEYLSRRYNWLKKYIPEISRAVTISAYCKMLEAKLQGSDRTSARLQNGDTLLIVTSQFNPSLNPLVVLSCFYDPSKEVVRYKEAADSIIATYDQWSDAFKDAFAYDFMATLLDNGEHCAAIDYFVNKPLKEFPVRQANFALDIATCAIATENDSLFSTYLHQALVLDTVAAEEYWSQLYNTKWDQYLDDPSQLNLADWLIESCPEPANNSFFLSLDMLKHMDDSDEASWIWSDISSYTPKQSTYRKAILYILDKGMAEDNGRSTADIAQWCRYIKAEMLLPDSATLDQGKAMLEALTESDDLDLRCKSIIGLAYISAHGLDMPKNGLKILKENIKLLDEPAVNSEIRNMWYDYMIALATRLGKTKDANKYLKLKDSTEN